MLRSREDAEDAVQTAFCSAFQHLHDFRAESTFRTWLTRIVVNCCLMQLRDRSAGTHVDFAEIENMIGCPAATPERLCYLAELQAAHAKAASVLPHLLHEVYAESAFSGVAFDEVVRKLRLTPNAAKSRLFRARRRIGHALRPLFRPAAARLCSGADR
jgi:RNA polymerase sigma-70 factor (ECF subfamily)